MGAGSIAIVEPDAIAGIAPMVLVAVIAALVFPMVMAVMPMPATPMFAIVTVVGAIAVTLGRAVVAVIIRRAIDDGTPLMPGLGRYSGQSGAGDQTQRQQRVS